MVHRGKEAIGWPSARVYRCRSDRAEDQVVPSVCEVVPPSAGIQVVPSVGKLVTPFWSNMCFYSGVVTGRYGKEVVGAAICS